MFKVCLGCVWGGVTCAWGSCEEDDFDGGTGVDALFMEIIMFG